MYSQFSIRHNFLELFHELSLGIGLAHAAERVPGVVLGTGHHLGAAWLLARALSHG